jgi:uncharacterized protein
VKASDGDESVAASFFWRRLHGPGHDACRLIRRADGWALVGAAVFADGARVCALGYQVIADAGFRTRRATLQGSVGRRSVAHAIRASRRSGWQLDGRAVEGVSDCVDLDLGFTPSTNLLAIRRLALRVGEAAEAPAAYLAFPALRIERLEQRYLRVSGDAYDYEAPAFGYRGRLRVSPQGGVVHYPGLFERVSR